MKIAIYSWFTHWKWWFSIVMLVYQRVSLSHPDVLSDPFVAIVFNPWNIQKYFKWWNFHTFVRWTHHEINRWFINSGGKVWWNIPKNPSLIWVVNHLIYHKCTINYKPPCLLVASPLVFLKCIYPIIFQLYSNHILTSSHYTPYKS